MALIVVNTVISGSAGSATCMVYKAVAARARKQKMEWSLEMCILGGLGGLVRF